jgi:hypothetical protein
MAAVTGHFAKAVITVIVQPPNCRKPAEDRQDRSIRHLYHYSLTNMNLL